MMEYWMYGYGPGHWLWFIVMIAVVIYPVGPYSQPHWLLTAMVDRDVHPAGQSDCALDSCIHRMARRKSRVGPRIRNSEAPVSWENTLHFGRGLSRELLAAGMRRIVREYNALIRRCEMLVGFGARQAGD